MHLVHYGLVWLAVSLVTAIVFGACFPRHQPRPTPPPAPEPSAPLARYNFPPERRMMYRVPLGEERLLKALADPRLSAADRALMVITFMMVDHAGGQWCGIQKGLLTDRYDTTSLVLFIGPVGSTIGVPLTNLNTDTIRYRIAETEARFAQARRTDRAA